MNREELEYHLDSNIKIVPIMLLEMHEVEAIVTSALTEGLTPTKLHDEA